MDPCYQSLDPFRREIRLIELLEPFESGEPRLRLTTVSLFDRPAYAALSYVWGDSAVTEQVTLNGEPRQVTLNVAAALKKVKERWEANRQGKDFCYGPEGFRLWVDALCINQNDVSERNHQVQMMSEIYSSAFTVLAWVSSEDAGTATVFEVLEALNHVVTVDCGGSFDFLASWAWKKDRPIFEHITNKKGRDAHSLRFELATFFKRSLSYNIGDGSGLCRKSFWPGI